MNAVAARRLRATAVPAPRGLGERLFARPDAEFFWDGSVGLGRAARLDAAGPARFADLRRRAAALFATIDGPAPPLFGGFAFDPEGDASFVLPRWLYRDGTLTYTGLGAPASAELEALPDDPPPPRTVTVDREPRVAYTARVAGIRAEIAAGRAEKIVAARRTVVSGAFSDAATVARLAGAGGLVFAFRRGATTFLGASPERLVARQGSLVLSEAIAGTSADGAFNPKDRAEHAPVVRAIAAALTAAGARAEIGAAAPRDLPDLSHLVTPIRARLSRPAHLLELAAALHPTPAVGGSPREAAVAWIRAHEPPRGWYTGAVGWFDAAGDGELRVALRCGLMGKVRAVLFTGAGIVAASDPDAEYDETVLKERPMLRALGGA